MRLNLLIFRKKNKLSQLDLAEVLGMTRQNYYLIENGFTYPRFDAIEKFHNKFPDEDVFEIFKICVT